MADQAYKFGVEVFGKRHEITVRQKSKSVWIASGNYGGQSMQAEGASASSARDHWQEIVRYRGNIGAPSPSRQLPPTRR
jgi:hypothetical protein